ncbi:cupin domain-containing protein [Staphylococcus lugdunensis]|uniref:cupin domain-containing protein n=1 Tax=Staphylococcus TaxID=1279 RepID=UPI0008A13D2C|nr:MULTISPECIES: cupin domain-containing protein [Staphylococcus]ARJ14660.1 cupin [Staphylococcus lugdunensis]MCH8665800.1 cupin domain-containing protein [Staphylococcus lugdunensis]OFJ64966.1 cupin [Staphylococcus sp. HMSC077E11]OFM42431.1 cupin [Staphylococcus sp. HMSC077E12]OFR90241.1 cupin [Staphylococcus sp. HMSC059F04]
MISAEEWINRLELMPHPEGGYYKETLRPDDKKRASYSSIYFLLKDADVSHFHRIDADEVWYYHSGETLLIHMITTEGKYYVEQLGQNVADGDVLQCVVPKGTIFASSLKHSKGYGIVGCMCQPAFEFEHFELLAQAILLEKYPQHQEIIKAYAVE